MRYLLLFALIFDPQIPYFVNGVGFTALVCPGLIIALLIKDRGRIKKTSMLSYAKPFAALHLIVLLYSLVVVFFVGDNYEYLLSVAKSIVVFSAVVAYILFYRPRFDEKFFSGVLFLYFANAVFNFCAGTFPEYFSWAEIFRGRVFSDSIGDNPYRNSFISGSGYYAIGTAYGLFCLLYIYFTSGKSAKFVANMWLLFIGLAGFVAARTSMFAIGAGVIYMFRKFQISKLVILMTIGAALIYFALGDRGILGPYKAWLVSFFEGTDDVSARYLLNEMFFWPGVDVFLHGSGFSNGGVFVYTDSGFMQDILFGGIFFMLLKFSFAFIFAAKFFKSDPLFMLLFLGVAVAFQIKGAFFVSNAQGMAVFYLMYFFFCHKYFGNSMGSQLVNSKDREIRFS